MSSSGKPAGTVVCHSSFDSLRLGRTSQAVIGRLLRFWDSRNVKKDEFMGITLLLLDEQDSVIHGFITANLANQLRSYLKAGCIVRLDRFEVARCAQTYKITEHQFVIRFISATRISALEGDIPFIKTERFMVRHFDKLQMLANTNLELPDVVGEIRSVQGSDLRNVEASTRVVVRLLIEQNVTVLLSLWDEAASAFRGLLKTGDVTKTVMLVTTINPKLFGGNLYLNSTSGSKFYFDTSIPEITEFINSVGGSSGQMFPCVDTLEGIKKKELVSIGDLNTYISNSNEQTQEADFLCKARIVSVQHENGWYFVSCTGCHKKLERNGSSLICSRCVSPGVTGVLRFRVELAVDDGKDCATFVVFDKEMTKLVKQEATELALEKGSNGEEDGIPECLEELAGKAFVFQIRVTPFNFTPSHRTFTVSTMTDCLNTEKDDEDHSVHIAPTTDVHVSLEPTMSSSSGYGGNVGIEHVPPPIPGGTDDNARRKRRRE